jgi:hypothetical protein
MSTHLLAQYPGLYLPLSAEPKLDQEGSQRVNRDGLPQWTLQVLHQPSAGKSDVIKVTLPAAAQPEFVPMQPLHFDGLRVDFYSMSGGAAGLWFAADSISEARGELA